MTLVDVYSDQTKSPGGHDAQDRDNGSQAIVTTTSSQAGSPTNNNLALINESLPKTYIALAFLACSLDNLKYGRQEDLAIPRR
jgi:hypothetical protein